MNIQNNYLVDTATSEFNRANSHRVIENKLILAIMKYSKY